MEANTIINEYTQISGIPFEDLQSPSQKQHLVTLRQCIWHSLRHQQHSFVEIGRLFGRNHSTVISGVNRVNDYLFTKDNIIEPYMGLLEKFLD